MTNNTISDKQLAANRANAKRSTGPGEEGKKRSSQNALTHGQWAREVTPISAGPFREDPDKFFERVEEIMIDLRPQGTAQMMAAKRAAAALMRLDRTDRAEAAVILETDLLEGMEKDRFPDPDDVFEHVMNIEVVLENIGYIAGTVTEVEDRPLWLYLAAYLRQYSPKPEVGVKDVWTKDITPTRRNARRPLRLCSGATGKASRTACSTSCASSTMSRRRVPEQPTATTPSWPSGCWVRPPTTSTGRGRRPGPSSNKAYNLLRNLQAGDIDGED